MTEETFNPLDGETTALFEALTDDELAYLAAYHPIMFHQICHNLTLEGQLALEGKLNKKSIQDLFDKYAPEIVAFDTMGHIDVMSEIGKLTPPRVSLWQRIKTWLYSKFSKTDKNGL